MELQVSTHLWTQGGAASGPGQEPVSSGLCGETIVAHSLLSNSNELHFKGNKDINTAEQHGIKTTWCDDWYFWKI